MSLIWRLGKTLLSWTPLAAANTVDAENANSSDKLVSEVKEKKFPSFHSQALDENENCSRCILLAN